MTETETIIKSVIDQIETKQQLIHNNIDDNNNEFDLLSIVKNNFVVIIFIVVVIGFLCYRLIAKQYNLKQIEDMINLKQIFAN